MLCVFLNDCVQAINSAYDRLANAHPSIGKFVLKPRQKRWYPQLYFHRNEEATVDGIDSAAPLKPDVVGLHEKDFNPKALPCCWGFLDATNPQVRIPVEVKKAWPELIWQAGTYARALRSATLERAFRLVFGYNQATCDFRVLIFHNGGLAVSLPCDLRSPSGRKDVVRMLWSVFLWQDAEDAGFPSFTDGDHLALDGSDNTDCIARRVAILSHSLTCRGRGTLVIKAQLCLPTKTATQSVSFIGLQPETCLNGGPRRTRASTQSKTQASKDRKGKFSLYLAVWLRKCAVDEREAKQATTGQKQLGSGTKKTFELIKIRQSPSPQPSSPGNHQSPGPSVAIDIPRTPKLFSHSLFRVFPQIAPEIRSVKYHDEAVAASACVAPEFRTLGAAFTPEDGLEVFQSAASRFRIAPKGSAPSSVPDSCVVRVSSPKTSGPGPLNETAMASACSGLFGLPITQTWFQACFKSGRPVSSALFEPTENGNDTSVHWSFSKDSKVNPDPDRRPMIICIMKEEGMSLERCAGAEDLCESILHALLGWLASYERGWLQRDPSIGNILRLCHDRVQSWGADTTLEEEGSEHLDKQLESFHLKSSTSVTLGTWDPKRASEVESAVIALGRPRGCKAILTDFDLSACMQDYFTAARADARSLSGTVEFMSVRLRAALDASQPYLQSPLDDLWAFFYTTVWATLFHAQRPSMDLLPLSSQELAWRLHIFKDSSLRYFEPMAPVLKDWHSALDQMDDVWTARQYQASTTGGVGLPDFNHLALQRGFGIYRYYHKTSGSFGWTGGD
ncbi:hypothetical protein R3P38DRAFT_3442984 [Favolaschia claudopus]|uniref:Fungal-type protein kinase domain-containing protein n=1 Tax=Favolaschia claudopus TaxID=2862362 RepID=A0AAV9ZRP6_9AGAR